MSKIVEVEMEINITIHDGKATTTLYSYADDPSNIYLAGLRVKPEFMNKGYGRELLGLCEKIVRGLDIITICLWVEEDSWMQDWYERLGYIYLKKHSENHVWMQKYLTTATSEKPTSHITKE